MLLVGARAVAVEKMWCGRLVRRCVYYAISYTYRLREENSVLKARKQFILDPRKIRKVVKLLKTRTETEAIDRALDLALGEEEIWKVMEALRGKIRIVDVYGRTEKE